MLVGAFAHGGARRFRGVVPLLQDPRWTAGRGRRASDMVAQRDPASGDHVGRATSGRPSRTISLRTCSAAEPRTTSCRRRGDRRGRGRRLEEGAAHVDAVEIDPESRRSDVQFHPQHPYQDPRVTRIIADGRAYLERTHAQYDLIIFALPDSLTLVAGQSAIRLESFLFTLQAFQAAHDRLAPGGSFAIYNFYREQWLADRLAGTMADVFGQRPCLDLGANGGGSVGQPHLHRQSRTPRP